MRALRLDPSRVSQRIIRQSSRLFSSFTWKKSNNVNLSNHSSLPIPKNDHFPTATLPNRTIRTITRSWQKWSRPTSPLQHRPPRTSLRCSGPIPSMENSWTKHPLSPNPRPICQGLPRCDRALVVRSPQRKATGNQRIPFCPQPQAAGMNWMNLMPKQIRWRIPLPCVRLASIAVGDHWSF